MEYFEVGFIIYWGVILLGSVFPTPLTHKNSKVLADPDVIYGYPYTDKKTSEITYKMPEYMG